MIFDILTAVFSLTAAVFAIVCFIKVNGQNNSSNALDTFSQDTTRNFSDVKNSLNQTSNDLRKELAVSLNQSMQTSSKMQADALRQMAETQIASLRTLQSTVNDQLTQIELRMKNNSEAVETRLENIRSTMETRVTSMQNENNKKLEEIRKTVDEQLQKTLESKLQQSFENVSKQLESVYKGLGEMQNLATGVGDLKKVLSNVKVRGILGEVQLGAILEQILSPEQYDKNVQTVSGSSERVEFAVKLPGDGQTPVLLPIDSKFPLDAYNTLIDAQESADKAQIEAAIKILQQRIRGFAKDIQTKYINVPNTTEFGIMFLPIEGLYAEVVQHGMIERLQAEFKIIVAGPTTMAALLNSLQMGFKTLAIQKSSGEVWKVLGNVKAEFDNFGKVLELTQTRLNQANDELEKLVGVRTRQIQRKLTLVENPKIGTSDIVFEDM